MMLLITQIPSKITGSKQFFKLKKSHLPVNLSPFLPLIPFQTFSLLLQKMF